MSAQAPTRLLERQDETQALDTALNAAASGAGCALSIRGPAGIGKTALLEHAARQAREFGFGVARATASELETAYPFGIVQQLFGAAVAALGPYDRDAVMAGTSDAAAAVMHMGPPQPAGEVDHLPAATHGLFWMAANLARRGPWAICVDDLQWADRPSARWVDYLCRRLDGLPIVVVVAARTGEPNAPAPEPPAGGVVLVPSALTADAARDLMERRLEDTVGDAFAHASHRATGGNPLLLEQLAAAVTANGWEGDDEHVGRLEGFGPPETEAYALRRLDGLGAEPAQVARAVAILGPSATTELAAELSGVDAPACARAADVLVGSGLFVADQPYSFAHPVLEAAVRNSLPRHRRAHMHREVARMLLDRDAAPVRVAPHLLQTDPDDDPAVVAVLREAAQDAAARGALDVAVQTLTRALAEPPARELAAEVALELGRFELQLGNDRGVVHLEEALRQAEDPRIRAQAALVLGPALLLADRVTESARVLESALTDLGDDAPGLRIQLDIALLSSAHLDLAEHERWSRHVAHVSARRATTPPTLRRVALGHAAQHSAFLGGPPDEIREIALRALDDGLLLREQTSDSPAYYFAASALVLAEAYSESRDALTAARVEAEERGSPMGFALASSFRALPNLRLGDLDAAEADSTDALAVIEEHGLGLVLPGAVIWLVEGLTARGRIDEAQDLLDRFGMDGPLPFHTWFLHLLEKRGALRIAQGRYADAITDLREAGRRSDAVGSRSICDVYFRSHMARALTELGRVREGEAVAREELALARSFGGSHAVARALLGLAAALPDGADAQNALTEARAAADLAGTPLVQARAAVHEGALLRRLGQRTAARDLLREGLHLASICGAAGLVARAREELAASGARIHREALTGPEALTPSERRIAHLAADGQSNREIARGIFVTEKTVETHLTAVYAKLGIGSRRELGRALPGRRVS